MKKNNVLLWIIIMAALFMSPFLLIYLINRLQYDSQIEGNPYKVAFEKEGKPYEVEFEDGNYFAFDQGTGDDQLYINSFGSLGDLIALSCNDFAINKTQNPFFAGIVQSTNPQKYYDQKTRYTSPKDSYQIYTYYDQNRNQILSYDPNIKSEYVRPIRPTFPMFSKSRYYSGGNKQNYLNVTKLLREKLNKNLKFRIDENNKLMILSFEN